MRSKEETKVSNIEAQTLAKNKDIIRDYQSRYYIDKKIEAKLMGMANAKVLEDPMSVQVFNKIGSLAPKGESYSIINGYFDAYQKGEQISALALFCDLEKQKLWLEGGTIGDNLSEFNDAAFDGAVIRNVDTDERHLADKNQPYTDFIIDMMRLMTPYLELYQKRHIAKQTGVLSAYDEGVKTGVLKEKK